MASVQRLLVSFTDSQNDNRLIFEASAASDQAFNRPGFKLMPQPARNNEKIKCLVVIQTMKYTVKLSNCYDWIWDDSYSFLN